MTNDLEHKLAAAYGAAADCPGPETWHRLAIGDLEPLEKQRLEAHREQCPACASEAGLAELFESPPGVRATREHEVARLVSRLEAESGSRRDTHSGGSRAALASPTSIRDRRPPSPARAAWPWAIAAALLLAVGVGLQMRRVAPPLGDPGSAVLRGSHLELTRPLGTLEGVPTAFEWESSGISENSEAAEYRVSIRRVDGTEVWASDSPVSPVGLPAVVGDLLRPAVTYLWQVEAFDLEGHRLSVSESGRFLIAPPAPELEAPPSEGADE